jgi:hypothetical protein
MLEILYKLISFFFYRSSLNAFLFSLLSLLFKGPFYFFATKALGLRAIHWPLERLGFLPF